MQARPLDTHPGSLRHFLLGCCPVRLRAKRRDCFPHPCGSMSLGDDAAGFPETDKRNRLQRCQPWSYLRLVAY